MTRSLVILQIVIALSSSAFAVDREFCSGESCAPDVMAVHFTTRDGSAEIRDLNVGDEFTVWVVIRNVDSVINAFSLGVAHDTEKLEIIEGAVSDEIQGLNPFFQNFSLAVGRGMEVNDDPENNPTRFGFVGTAILPVIPAPGVSVPQEANFPLCWARYRVATDLDNSVASLISIRGDLVPNLGAPQTVVNYSINNQSISPRTVGDGEVFGGGGAVAECDDWGLYFGSDSSSNHTVSNDSFAISLRNSLDALGVSMGVKLDGVDYSFRDRELGRDLGGGDVRLVDLIITDENGDTQNPTVNTATGPADLGVANIELGADLEGISNPFFQINLNPNVGGLGFTIAYAADVSGSGAKIPVTEAGNPCPVRHLFTVTLGEGSTQPFSRGDVNGDGALNITDVGVLAQNIFLSRLKFFDCEDMLDANDDGNTDTSDAVALISWIILGSANLPGPFVGECGLDPVDDDGLACVESNCQ